jgi:hypothetical protein
MAFHYHGVGLHVTGNEGFSFLRKKDESLIGAWFIYDTKDFMHTCWFSSEPNNIALWKEKCNCGDDIDRLLIVSMEKRTPESVEKRGRKKT